MTTNPRLLQLKGEFTDLRGGLQYLDELAAVEGRAFTDAEQVAYDGACTRMEAIEADITTTLARQERFDAVAGVVADITEPAPGLITGRADYQGAPIHTEPRPTRPFDAFDLGEYAKVVGRATVDRVLGRVDDETLQRVVAHGVSSDGTAPVTIEGDLVKFVDANRYAVNAARLLPMPDNKAPTFKRPRVSQRTTAGSQANEGDVLSSQRMQVTGDTVTKLTRGGVLSLSEQEVDWTDPAMLGLAIQDLAESYAIDTDNVLCDAIEAAATANDSTETILAATLPTAAAFVAAVTAASGVAYASAKRLPDTLFVDTNWWSRILGIVDTTGRPVFPPAGQSVNSHGTSDGVTSFGGINVLGLNVVVDPNFTADFMCVAVSSLVEFYEQNKGLLSINAPSTLEVQYAYRGYVAANVYNQAIASIEAV